MQKYAKIRCPAIYGCASQLLGVHPDPWLQADYMQYDVSQAGESPKPDVSILRLT